MTDESQKRLRDLYAADGGVRAIFTDKVADYVASRPGYPSALFDGLEAAGVLRHGIDVADVGAGTGLLTRDLLARGARVVAVEPNAAMRAAADGWLGAEPEYRSVEGAAESTGLPSEAFDVVTAAQAFHWFDVPRARREFLRILRPEGIVVLVWNDRVREHALHVALDEIFADVGGEKRGALLAHEHRGDVGAFFGGVVMREIAAPMEHSVDREQLRALVLSRSYMPTRTEPRAVDVVRRVDAVFDRFATEAGQVVVPYRTLALLGRPSAA